MFVAAIWRTLAAVSGLGGQYWGCQQDETLPIKPPLKPLPVLPQNFFARPAEEVAPELIGCLL
jgi:hypothetical protein